MAQSYLVAPNETGWRVAGYPAWLHTLVSEQATAYVIDPTRSGAVAEDILELDYDGTMIHDGSSPCDQFEKALHQQCLSHLLHRADNIRLVFAQTDNGQISATNFSPDGRHLAGFQDDLHATKPPPSEVKLWDTATGKEVGAIVAPEGATPFQRPGGGINGAFAAAVFSPDSRWLATCLHSGRVYL